MQIVLATKRLVQFVPLYRQLLWEPIYHRSACISSHNESASQNLQQSIKIIQREDK